MFRSFLSAAAIFVLLFSIFFLPASVSARSRCPVKMPETLLSLYQNSDAIHIATFDKKADGEITEDTADYTSLNVKKHFSISSTLKGESRKFFVLDDTEYRYKTTTETTNETDAGEEAEDDEASVVLKPGDTLLLFLKNGEGGEAPTLTDYRDGTKKLSMEHIGVYEARIKDLDSIFGEKKVSEARIVEWLIRSAEDPATRWEGTFELLQSFQEMEWREEAAEQRKARIARGEPVEEEANESDEPDEEGAEERRHKNVDTSNFAKLLDANQKQTLANILLDRPAPAADENDNEETKIAGDHELIELVKRFGDPRLVGFLLDQLRANKEDPNLASRTMATIAQILDDKEVETIAEKYGEIAYEDDEDEAEAAADEAEVAAEDEAASRTEVVETQTEAVNAVENEDTSAVVEAETEAPDSADVEEDKPKKKTYREMRDEILQKFLQRCESVMAAADEDRNLKAAR